tara:strand:- start:48263 stop:49651 length:1389 start_codon:yes stop_codon:yes gene_type:complete
MKIMIKNISILLVLMASSLSSRAQDTIAPQTYTFTLQEAIVYGLENSYTAKNASRDVAISLKQKWEIIAQGLPQIGGKIDYQNYLKQPVTLIPGEIAGGAPGTFVPVTFGTKQNVNATGTWNQVIFDGSYIVGVQSAKTLLQISENAKVKSDLEVKQAIVDAYGNVLISRKSVEILEKNVTTITKTLDDTNKIFENGLAEEEDVEQLQITLLGLETNLNNAKRQQAIALDMLKVTLGIPLENQIIITDNLEDLTMQYYDLGILQQEIAAEENIDYRIAEDQVNSAATQVKLEKAKALPSLTAFVNYGFQGNSNEFSFLDSDQEYFQSSILGVSLNIPIFSSGMRSARTAQKQIAYEQSLEQLEETRNRVKLQIASAKNDYKFSLDNYANQQKNLALAERIENKNQIKFFEGIATSFELSEAQSQLYQAQQDYLQAMLDVISYKAALEKVLDTSKYQPEDSQN